MQVASNTLQHLLEFYHQQIDELHGPIEAESMFYEACAQRLKKTKSELKNNLHLRLQQSDLIVLYDQAKAIKSGIPFQYVTGKAYFFDAEFFVSPAVLIPRPETEELVERIIKNNSYQRILDIGTGSGCIAIQLSKHHTNASVTAIDISPDTLAIAQKNNTHFNTSVQFLEIDILSVVQQEQLNEFDCIVSNPPYISDAEKETLAQHVIDHEPHSALFSGNDALVFYKRIIDFCNNHLEQNGALWFELNPLTAKAVEAYAHDSQLFKSIEIIKDITNKDRILHAIKK